MRLAKDADRDRLRELWAEAYGELADGSHAIDAALDEASWIGVLEADREIVAFAANGEVVDAEGRILTAAVAPEARRQGYGKLALAAAAYQLTTQGARAATVIGRPDVPFALRTVSARLPPGSRRPRISPYDRRRGDPGQARGRARARCEGTLRRLALIGSAARDYAPRATRQPVAGSDR